MTSENKLDLVLVNPGNRVKIYQSLSSTLAAVEPPVWAGLMATFVRNHGFSVSIIDATAEELSSQETAEKIAELNPVLTAVVVYGQQPSASTQVMPGASAVCTAIKQISPNFKVLLVGGHVAALPERSLREEDTDFVAAGEGLYTMLELLAALKSDAPDYSKVRGLWYWEGKEVKANPPAPLLMDVETKMPGICCQWRSIGPTIGTVLMVLYANLMQLFIQLWAVLSIVVSAVFKHRLRRARKSWAIKKSPIATVFGAPNG